MESGDDFLSHLLNKYTHKGVHLFPRQNTFYKTVYLYIFQIQFTGSTTYSFEHKIID